MSVFLPCLLERWSSPLHGKERLRSGNSWADVRADVLRNLEWLLNTEEPTRWRLTGGDVDWPAEPDVPPAVRKSVLCYGVPAYSGKVQSSFDLDEVAWAIRERILAFESRIDRSTLTVSPLGASDQHRFNRLRFKIYGYLRADPLPLEFIAQSELDMESGTAKVFA